MKPVITIEYCTKCGWLLRAAYMAQEILTTFSEEVKAVALQPAEISGSYMIYSGRRPAVACRLSPRSLAGGGR